MDKNGLSLLQIGEELQKFAALVDKAGEHPLVYYHDILQEILRAIKNMLPKYISILTSYSPSLSALKVLA